MAVAYPYSHVMASRRSIRHSGVVDGITTAWWEYNSVPNAPTIVMIHGFRGDHHGLELFADALQEYRVIIPDLPGFGESSSWSGHTISADGYGRWLRAFLKHTQTAQSIVLGHSFGTIVVANGLRGERTSPIILVNPISQRALSGPNRFMTAIASGWYGLATVLPEKIGNALLSMPLSVRIMSEFLAKSRDNGLRRWIHNQHALYFSKYSDRQSLVGAYSVSVSHDVSEYASGVVAPVLLVVADQDEITPMSAQEHVREVFPDARLTVLSGVGHLVHYEKPLETAAAIRKFLAQR